MAHSSLDINYKAGDALIVALKHRDEYTQNHCLRVGKIAIHTGLNLGWDVADIKTLEIAAIFHDIGKIGVPDRILFHPDKLSEADYELMKTHVEVGANIVEKLDIPNADEVAKIILHHHENFDGTGYPAGLAGEDIPLASRIISVIDVFDALTSSRVYRQASDVPLALNKMTSEMKQQFDPDIFELVTSIIQNLESN